MIELKKLKNKKENKNMRVLDMFFSDLKKTDSKLYDYLQITPENGEDIINDYFLLQEKLYYFLTENPDLMKQLHHSLRKNTILNINICFIDNFFNKAVTDNTLLFLNELVEHKTLSEALKKTNRTLYELTFKIPEEKREYYIINHNFLDFEDPELVGSVPDILHKNKNLEMNLIKMIFDRTADKKDLIEKIMVVSHTIPKKIQKKFLNSSFKKEELRPYAFLYLAKLGFIKSANYLIKSGYKPNQTEIEIFNVLVNKFKNDGKKTITTKLLNLYRVDNYHVLYSHIINKKHDKAIIFLNSLNKTDKEELLTQIKEKQNNFNYAAFETNIRKKAGYRKNKETPLMINAIMAHDLKLINELITFGYTVNDTEKYALFHALIHNKTTDWSQWQPVSNIIIKNTSWQEILSGIHNSNFIYPNLQDNLIAGFQLSIMLSQVLPEKLSHSDYQFINDILENKEQGGLKNEYLRYYLYNKINKLEYNKFYHILNTVLLNSQNHKEQVFFISIIMHIYDQTKQQYNLKKELNQSDIYEQNQILIDYCIKRIDSIVERQSLSDSITIENKKVFIERL